jgi:hypothetical protein
VIDLKYLYLIKDYKNLLDRLAKYPRNSIFLAEPKLLGFKIYYPDCLSQKEIGKYNVLIGNANNLINRYNQLQDEKNKKLRLFKTLYKQIDCDFF